MTLQALANLATQKYYDSTGFDDRLAFNNTTKKVHVMIQGCLDGELDEEDFAQMFPDLLQEAKNHGFYC